MAKARSHGILEWVHGFDIILTATSGTTENQIIDLNLMDDEIAEIWGIHSEIMPISASEIDNGILAGLMLSMDPDNVANPLADANLADLEVFYDHRLYYQQGLTTDGFSIARLSDIKKFEATERHPILVGTNVGMSSNYTEVAAITSVTFAVRLYFTRRKANVSELNQILLKRR